MVSKTPSLSIGSRFVGEDTLPYIIAEVGVNHEGSLEKARELVALAAEGGVQAVKFQTYKAETLASRHSPAYWDLSQEPTRSQFELFKKYDAFGDREYEDLAQCCRDSGVDFLSTPFDVRAVDFLAPLMPCIKIASADITNVPLLRRAAETNKPVLLSTGAATLGEVDTAVAELTRSGCPSLALLHCILNYPTPHEHANLNMIFGLQRAYPHYVIGYSDHTRPDECMSVLTTAYIKGARILEKHFTHDKMLPGNDHYHAMDVDDLQRLNKHLQFISTIEGQTHKQPLVSETPARAHARRSIVLVRDARGGETLNEDLLTCKRPGSGISPLHWDAVIGRTLARDLEADAVLQWQDLAPKK